MDYPKKKIYYKTEPEYKFVTQYIEGEINAYFLDVLALLVEV
jgi:hypothetical protein